MPSLSSFSGPSQRLRRRALFGAAALATLVLLAGLIGYLSRDDRSSPRADAPRRDTAASASPHPAPSSRVPQRRGELPKPPSTTDPLAYGKAAAVALWSYDTRAYSQDELRAAMHTWLTRESQYTDVGSLDALIPSPVLWDRMADHGQYATASAVEARFPMAFTEALQSDPRAITEAYIYAVTVSGEQSIGWDGSPRGGAERRSVTLAVQCRPEKPCALSAVLPNVAP